MKRARRWLVIFAALVCLMTHAGALRATSLIFAKGPTSTTTTTTTENSDDVQTTEIPGDNSDNNTSTKSTLTGIPQIDYIWDPNLPRELNGYNLSEYPFYNAVPPMEEIDFKCDGLHDGFYASVKHKCQLYHHCLYGVRYDFLCANFTAFDQKTFICHFVSEVDCKNSPKYFHRNDALYQAASTTTTTTTTTTVAPPPTQAPSAHPAGHPRRRPLRRRRPQVDYYYYDDDYDDDYYEERRNRRRKQRPRPRRPEYDDDYEDRRGYNDEDRYDKRMHNRDRSRDDDDGNDDYDRKKLERPRNRNRSNENRQNSDDDRHSHSADRRKENDDRRLPPSEERRSGDRRYGPNERRNLNDDRHYPKERNKTPSVDPPEDEIDPRGRKRLNGDRRPIHDDDIDRPPRRRDEDRPHRKDKEDDKDVNMEKVEEEKPLVKPAGPGGLSSLFARRAPPKVARPVPATEKKKFEYVTKRTTTSRPLNDDEYYDDYEEVVPKRRPEKEENVSNGRRSFTSGGGGNGRKDHKTIRDDEEKETEKSNPPTLDREDRRRLSPIRTKDESKNRYENSRESSEKEVERSGGGDIKRSPSTSQREDYRHKYDVVDDTSNERDDRLKGNSQKTRYRPILKNNYRGPTRREQSEEQDEIEEQSNVKNPPRLPSKGDRFRTVDRDRTEESVEDRKETESTPSKLPPPPPPPVDEEIEKRPLENVKQKSNEEVEKTSSEEEHTKELRPVIRVVKRPFLPSRGGSPYLPRGLQAVGGAAPQPTTESIPIDMGSTVSGVRLLEHSAPLVRSSVNDDDYPQPHQGPRTTQQPQIDPPKSSLEEIYDNEYDVTLNDALNPTLRPLTVVNRGYPSGFSHSNKFDNNRFPSAPAAAGYNTNNQNNDSYYSSSDVRSRVVGAPNDSKSRTHSNSRRSNDYYEDEYDY